MNQKFLFLLLFVFAFNEIYSNFYHGLVLPRAIGNPHIFGKFKLNLKGAVTITEKSKQKQAYRNEIKSKMRFREEELAEMEKILLENELSRLKERENAILAEREAEATVFYYYNLISPLLKDPSLLTVDNLRHLLVGELRNSENYVDDMMVEELTKDEQLIKIHEEFLKVLQTDTLRHIDASKAEIDKAPEAINLLNKAKDDLELL